MDVSDNILDFIPQRHPFVMVDELVSVDDSRTVSSFYITQHTLFSESGEFYEAGLIENMAQTVAAGAGLTDHAAVGVHGLCRFAETASTGLPWRFWRWAGLPPSGP